MNMIEWLTAFGCLFAVCGVGGMFVMDFLFDLVVHSEEGFKRLCRFTWWSLGLSALCLSAAFALFFWGRALDTEGGDMIQYTSEGPSRAEKETY